MSENPQKAYDLINSVKRDLKTPSTSNEYFVSCLNEFASDCQNKLLVPKGEILYRARIYLEDDRFQKYNKPTTQTFQGYDAAGSFINPSQNISNGRANDDFRCLYVSTTVDGCIIEVRPYANSLVSVAGIRANTALCLLDFSKGMTSASGKDSMFKATLFQYINRTINEPCYDGDYKFTQFISRIAKDKGFDGIAYCSAYSRSIFGYEDDLSPYINYAIYNYEKCEAISSTLYMINRITVQKRSCRE